MYKIRIHLKKRKCYLFIFGVENCVKKNIKNLIIKIIHNKYYLLKWTYFQYI